VNIRFAGECTTVGSESNLIFLLSKIGPPRKKPKISKPGLVRKVTKHANEPEKVEITIPAAKDPYREIRIENKLEDDEGKEVKLKPGDSVDVTIEADKQHTEHPTEEDKFSVNRPNNKNT
jgi:hypothetical protein